MKAKGLWCVVALCMMFVVSPVFAAVLVLQPDGAAGKDALISDSSPDTNQGDGTNYGEYLVINFQGTDHGMIEFNLSSVPTGSVINSATLEVRETTNCHININTIEVHLNNGAWSESTVTWNNAPSYGASLGTCTGDTSDCDWLIFDVASAVQQWVNQTASNYGFRITGPSGGDVVKYILSSDTTTAEFRPILRIDYTPSQTQSVPTLNEWGMMIFMGLAGVVAVYSMRRQKVRV